MAVLSGGVLCVAMMLSTAPAVLATSSSKADHVFLFIMENKDYSQIVYGPDAPFYKGLSGGRLTNYWAVAHPSLPNYVAMMGAWPPLPVSDDPRIRISGNSFPEEMVRHSLSVGAYMQGLPRPGYGGSHYPRLFSRYVLKHDPFLLFARLRQSSVRQSVVPLQKLKDDLSRGTVPSFSIVIPDLCHDMHGAFSCHFHNVHELIRKGDDFLAHVIPMIQNSPLFKKGHVWIFIVWDESQTQDSSQYMKPSPSHLLSGPSHVRILAGGHVPILWIDSRNSNPWQSPCFANHYSLLETLTRNFDLPSLTPPGEGVPLPRPGTRCSGEGPR